MDVIIPTRNRPALTAEAVRAVQAQSFTDWHLWVVDDASTDHTADHIDALAAEDRRITVVRLGTPVGANPARQVGLECSDAPLVAICDSDDLWEPTKLALQVEAHDRAARDERSPAMVGPVVCWHDALAEDGTRRGSVIRPRLNRRWHPFALFNTSTPLFSRALLEQAGGFTTADPYPWTTTDHLDLFLRTTRHRSLVVVPELLVHCRHHGGERNSDRERTTDAALEAEHLLAELDESLRNRPGARAWMYATVAGRHLDAGDLRRAAPFMATALRVAPPATAAAMAVHYGPWALRRLASGSMTDTRQPVAVA